MNITSMSKAGALTSLLVWVGSAGTSSAALSFSASAGDRSAQVVFSDLGGGNLEVRLVNSYAGDTVDQSHVLTAVFFSGANGLTPISAVAPAGSLFWNFTTSSPAPGASVLGQQWQYLSGLSGAPGGATAGISSAGLGVFGSGNFASGGVMLDGSAYGLLSAGYQGYAQDGLDHRDYIQNSMVFTLSGFGGNLAGIGNVTFQYGTSLTEPSIASASVPEADFGAAMITLTLGATGLAMLRRTPRAGISC